MRRNLLGFMKNVGLKAVIGIITAVGLHATLLCIQPWWHDPQKLEPELEALMARRQR